MQFLSKYKQVFLDIEIHILKFICKSISPSIAKTVLNMMNTFGGFSLPY